MASVRALQDDPQGHLAAAAAQALPLRVLFVMRSLGGYLRFYRSALELLVSRGHEVHLLIERTNHGEVEQAWLERMLDRPGFTFEIDSHFGRWSRPRGELRKCIEYVRVLRDGTDRTTIHFRHRLRDAPRWIVRFAGRRGVRTSMGLRILHALLGAADDALSAPSAARAYLSRLDPDVVVLSDHGNVGSLHSAYAKAAKERGTPVALCVATWDNLSSRQRTRVLPDALLVWNREQLREAVELHRIPERLVEVTGAPHFDDWFEREPRSREAFLSGIGLDPAKPVVLWVGGALYRAERTEAEYALSWLEALRAAEDPLLREAGVLLRPHPVRLKQWLEIDVSSIPNAVVFPLHESFPTSDEAKADFFDSIHHAAAVVGLNTSAMIEASIVGRPVLTVLEPDFRDSQEGTFHFAYLLEPAGPVRAFASTEEQFAALATLLRGEDGGAVARAGRFVRDFVRPNGLDRAVSPLFVDTIEQVARSSPTPQPDSAATRLAGRLVRAGFRAAGLPSDPSPRRGA